MIWSTQVWCHTPGEALTQIHGCWSRSPARGERRVTACVLQACCGGESASLSSWKPKKLLTPTLVSTAGTSQEPWGGGGHSLSPNGPIGWKPKTWCHHTRWDEHSVAMIHELGWSWWSWHNLEQGAQRAFGGFTETGFCALSEKALE